MSILNNVNNEVDTKATLLSLNLPSYRQAYSDRTAWLMATFSELAYIRFNPALPSKLQKLGLEEALKNIVNESKNTNLVKAISIMEGLLWDHEEEKNRLVNELNTLNESKLINSGFIGIFWVWKIGRLSKRYFLFAPDEFDTKKSNLLLRASRS